MSFASTFSEWLEIHEQKVEKELWQFAENLTMYFWPIFDGTYKKYLNEAKGYDGPDPCRDALGGSGKLDATLASQIHKAAQLVKAKAFLDNEQDPSEIGIQLSPEEIDEKSERAWQFLSDNLYPLILRFTCRMGRSWSSEDPQVQAEVAQEIWMKMMRYLQDTKTTKKKGGKKSFPDDFVGFVASSARRGFSNFRKDKRRQLQPSSFIKTGDQGDDRYGPVVHGGGDPGRIGQYGSARRGGKGVGGDENAAAAQAMQSAVGSAGNEGGETTGGVTMPGGSPRYEIPGMSDARDFNHDLLHQALDALSKEGSFDKDYHVRKGALAAMAWKVRFGLMSDSSGSLADIRGISQGNLDAKSDLIRRYGEPTKVRAFGEKPSWKLSPEKMLELGFGNKRQLGEMEAIAHEMMPQLNAIADSLNVPIDAPTPEGWDDDEWEEYKQSIDNYRQENGIQMPVTPPPRPNANTVKTWMARSKDYLMNYLLPKGSRQQATGSFKLPSDLSRPGSEEDVDGVDYRPMDQRFPKELDDKLKGGLGV